MPRHLVRWAAVALVTLGSIGLVGFPALAQYANKSTPPTDVNQAKEMAQLISQGQMNLRDATALAEKHAAGTALQAVCNLQSGEMQPRPEPQPTPSEPGRRENPPTEHRLAGGKRLMYDVSVFAKDKVETVHVDGATKKVVEGPEIFK